MLTTILGILIKSLFDNIWEYSITEEKVEYEGNNVQVESESVYCNICSACGEEGCCSPLLCQQHKDGSYCEWYLRDLKYGYKSYNDIIKYIDENYNDDSDLIKKIKEINDENYNKFY